MTRRTSIDVYHQIEAEGLLSKRRWEVYDYLFKHGPLTQREVSDSIATEYAHHQSYTPRFAELEARGVIESVGERPCSVTGRNVLVWDVTDRLPVEPDATGKPKPMPRKEVQQRMKAYREVLVLIWKDKRTPPWMRDVIRNNTKQFRKDKT